LRLKIEPANPDARIFISAVPFTLFSAYRELDDNPVVLVEKYKKIR
jgi:hypothetical protein